ncbi:hypothetical protein E3N88_32632 [Mikania micrantha]|uniref:Uncharacterized protein n=1 Tax=Mikania micrantha TaxID=192012 RepID=A0A5N6M9J7_9ASTR|nr:hypothetical protein E3N88_32632 [Mikania micrantha]
MTTLSRRLEGKVALITGASSGIGESIAKLFAEHGAKIIIADIQDELGQAVCDDISPSNSIYVHCDVTNEEDVKNAIDTTITAYGKLDIMLNNAGITGPNKALITDNEKSDFERVLNVDVTGSIISMASLASIVAGVTPHAYCCAKHAVVGLTKNLAAELGQFGIRVNCLSPHGIATPLTTSYTGLQAEAIENEIHMTGNLKGVMLKTDDVANAALFLASEESKYISGQNICIDGGAGIVNPAITMFKNQKHI